MEPNAVKSIKITFFKYINFFKFIESKALKYANGVSCVADYQCEASVGLICETVCT
jgi:hypothetical protein